MKPKNQRLILVSAALAAVLLAVLLAMWGLRDRASYFYTPTEVDKAPLGKVVRLGGMVEKGSLVHKDALTIQFAVTDATDRVTVRYRGITPDLFREGSGVVAEGKMLRRGLFVADTILAKHDERYMPPELGNLAAEHKAAKTLQR
ncbi:MAG: cytochrome c maturation protein CcmE [Sphingomicrobium sp.]